MGNFPLKHRGVAYWVLAASTLNRSTWRNFAVNASTENSYKTVQVHIVHRHGDRSPITPLVDEDYWSSQLIPPIQLDKIAENTSLKREGSGGYSHAAGGRGPFGKLSELGLFQMIKVGLDLRKEFVDGGELLYSPLFDAQRPLSKDTMRVVSTDFPRTIQSVQGLLLGLLDEETPDKDPIEIDVRHTTMMIPDPQPRETKEQGKIESYLVNRPHMLKREAEKLILASRVTEALHPLLAADAHEANFGVVQEHPENVSIETEPLAWNQLAEITKCLEVRDRLPPGVSKEDVEEIGQHTAWRWFEILSDPRLIYLAMNEWTSKQVEYMTDVEHQPPLTIWSCHDSSLIGLLCAYRLEKPKTWPEYSSVLLMEVVEIGEADKSGKPQLAVRFSLNGERLRIMWDPENPMDMIPLQVLAEKIRTEGSAPSEFAELAEQ